MGLLVMKLNEYRMSSGKINSSLSHITQKSLQEAINEALSTLTPREEKVLRLRFGLDDRRIRTLEEVGEELNTTRERIRHIEAKALRKLRHPFCSAQLRDFL